MAKRVEVGPAPEGLRFANPALLASVCCFVILLQGGKASGEPLPGFDLDPAQLQARMDACVSYQVGEQEVLMGWVKRRTGETRHWR